jgi:glycosyltransferase involved in cell wall biosynthesis
MPKILISSRCAWSLINYRSGQMRSLRDGGDEVVAAGASDGYEDRLAPMGIKFVELPVPFKSINPLADLRLFWHFFCMYRRERPEVVHHFTIKPVIYGSIAARLAGVPRIVNTITGLGFVFSDSAGPWLRRVVELEYRTALSCSHLTFFQNQDDQALFIKRHLVEQEKTGLVPGSGVNTQQFAPVTPVDAGECKEQVVFLMMARLLRDKGVYEFIEAASRIKSDYPHAIFQLLGKRDEHNPAVVPLEDLERWRTEGIVEYLGEVSDVRQILSNADVMVLPSYYREGTPRSLLEAAAMAKPIITTDNVGCREVVDHGVNGLLIPVKNAAALTEAMICMLEDPKRRTEMGLAGRDKIVREFDEQIVIQKCRAAYHVEAGHLPVSISEATSET